MSVWASRVPLALACLDSCNHFRGSVPLIRVDKGSRPEVRRDGKRAIRHGPMKVPRYLLGVPKY